MKKKSPAFYRFCQDMASDHISYYDTEEVENVVYDLLDMHLMDEAEFLAEQGLLQHPNDDTMEKLVIWIYLHNHKIEKSEKMFQKFINDDSEWAVRMKFSYAIMHGHPQKALDGFIGCLYNGMFSPLDWVNCIDDMSEALPFEVLSPFLVKAAEFIDKDAEALGRIGGLLLDAQQFEEAAKAIEKSLDIDAYDIFSWQDLARCYLLLQNFQKCMEACNYGLAIEEKNFLLGFIKGYIHYQQQEYKECIPYLLNTRSFAEGHMNIPNLNMSEAEIHNQINITYEMLGYAFMNTEKYDESKECFEILTERCPLLPNAWIQLSNIYSLEGDLNKAYEYIEKALQTSPKDECARSLQISILTSMHKFPEALKALKEIIRLKPKNMSYLLAYAELSRHYGLNKEADTAYRKLLKMSIHNKSYKQLLLAYFQSIGDDDAVNQLTNNNE